jgi:excisionase family DNA binding protein
MTLKTIHPRAEARTDADETSQQFRYGWIGPAAAMAHLGVSSLSILYRLIKEWELPYGRMGRLYRFRRADLDQWIARRGSALDRTA